MLFLHCFSLSAQSPVFSWKFILDGYNDVYLADIVVDSLGNTYVGANYTAPLEIPGLQKKLPYPGHVHGLIVKLNPQGKAVWAHPFKSSFDNRIKDIALAPNGDLLITGFGDGLLHFPGLHDTLKTGVEVDWNNGSRTLHQGFYAARYSPDGERKWAQYFNSGWGEGLSIAANRDDEVFMTWYFAGSVRQGNKLLDSIRERNIQYRFCLARMDGKGRLKTTQTIIDNPAAGYTVHSNIQFDRDDNMLLYGTFFGRINLSPTDSLTNKSYYESLDGYLAKYNKEGRLLWSKKIGGQSSQVITGIAIAADNSIYATGTYDYECVLGDGINVLQKSKYEYKSGSNLFYFHLFADGELDFIRYEESKGYSSYFSGQNIAVDRNGSTHIVGYFTDTIRIDGLSATTSHHNYTGFYSLWKNNKLMELNKPGNSPHGSFFTWKISTNEDFISIGGEYYGDSATLYTKDGTEPLPNKDNGRIAFVLGGRIEEKTDTTEPLYVKDARETRLTMVKLLTACTAPMDSGAADVWLPLDTAKTKAPCGNPVKGMKVYLFPNPTSGQVNIKLEGITGMAQLEVFSEKGQLVLSHRIQDVFNGQSFTLDLHGLSSGTYLVRITHGQFQKGLKLVKIG